MAAAAGSSSPSSGRAEGRLRSRRDDKDNDVPSPRPCSREPAGAAVAELLPPGPGLLDQLVEDLQSHLDEMEQMRIVLVDAYPPRPRSQGRPDDDTYHFSLDVAGFGPQELAVKLVGRKLTVTGRHDRRTEAPDGCVSHEYREVRREIRLPADANLDGVACTFAPDGGRLCINAPRLAQLPPAEERSIPIAIRPASVAAATPDALEGADAK